MQVIFFSISHFTIATEYRFVEIDKLKMKEKNNLFISKLDKKEGSYIPSSPNNINLSDINLFCFLLNRLSDIM